MAKVKKDYTVVGLYHDNKQVWIGHVKTAGISEAVAAAKDSCTQECSRCGGIREEPGAPERPGEVALCIGCNGTGVESSIAVLSVFKGKLKDEYGEDELLEN